MMTTGLVTESARNDHLFGICLATGGQEGWRPAFHRRHFTSIRQLQAEADAWLIRYNHRRKNHGD